MAAKKHAKNGKAKRPSEVEPIILRTYIIPVTPWKSREEALAYVRGEFQDWCMVLEDLVEAQAYVDPAMIRDLGTIAERAADYLEDPVPFEVDRSQAVSHFARLARSLADLNERSGFGSIGFANEQGLHHELAGSTLGLLGHALSDAVNVSRTEVQLRVATEARA